MKEASGELSMTAVAVVAIAAISLVFTTLIWPNIKANITRSAKCSQAYNCDCNSGDTCTCYYLNDSDSVESIQCPNKDAKKSETKSGN